MLLKGLMPSADILSLKFRGSLVKPGFDASNDFQALESAGCLRSPSFKRLI